MTISRDYRKQIREKMRFTKRDIERLLERRTTAGTEKSVQTEFDSDSYRQQLTKTSNLDATPK